MQKTFTLPTLKSVIDAIESGKEGEPSYQGQKLKYYTREKQYLRNHIVYMVRSILLCYEDRYSDVYPKQEIIMPLVVTKFCLMFGDKVLFDVCQVLNSAV